MSARVKSKDPDIIGSFTALKRAAKAARKLSIELGTPFFVMDKSGRIVDLNAKQPAKRRPKSRAASNRSATRR